MLRTSGHSSKTEHEGRASYPLRPAIVRCGAHKTMSFFISITLTNTLMFHVKHRAIRSWLNVSCQPACKPGSVWRESPSATAIPLGRGSLRASSNQPGRRRGSRWMPRLAPEHPCRPYSVLLPVGFAVPPALPHARCALTAPFHPCHCGLPRAGGLFSVALSLGSPPAAVSRHRRSLEPGLSSTGDHGRKA